MNKKVSTASVGKNNLELAKAGLKERQDKGIIDKDDIVLSIQDHGDKIAVYTQSASFNVMKDFDYGSASKTG